MTEYIDRSYRDILEGLTPGGLADGRAHLQQRLAQQRDPHERLPLFHVAGTNGKGSVCQMLSQVLWKQYNKKVGLFISPHLVDINERIQINGNYIEDADLERLIGKVYEATKDFYPFSYFELLTLVAIEYFLEQDVDYAVFEVGLGGTLDSTNVWSAPVATFITSISQDHTRLLGRKLSQIQENKMGIMKPEVPCYTPVDNALMHTGAKKKKADLHIIHDMKPTNLAGDHQQQNAALVYHALVDLGYDAETIRRGLQDIDHPGRLQYVRPNILVDGAHNLASIQALTDYIDTIRQQRSSIITIFGSSKRVDEIAYVADTLIAGDANYLIQPQSERGLDPASYRDLVPMSSTIIEEDLASFLSSLLTQTPPNTLIIIYGSLYLVGEALARDEVHS